MAVVKKEAIGYDDSNWALHHWNLPFGQEKYKIAYATLYYVLAAIVVKWVAKLDTDFFSQEFCMRGRPEAWRIIVVVVMYVQVQSVSQSVKSAVLTATRSSKKWGKKNVQNYQRKPWKIVKRFFFFLFQLCIAN